jgi:uncharacterized protein
VNKNKGFGVKEKKPDRKYSRLVSMLKKMEGIVVAFSGGVDSSLLLAAAVDALGEKALGITATSPTYSMEELTRAKKVASIIGARLVLLETHELESIYFKENPIDRCYHCKKELFEELKKVAVREGLPVIMDGNNIDDLGDYRPGARAAKEACVRSPFVELGIGKNDIRKMARERGLPNWNEPAHACLASRIPYGEEITLQRLERIGKAERGIRAAGFVQFRVRDHGTVARVELAPSEISRALPPVVRKKIVAACKKAGYAYVAMDLEGYKTGSMNRVLKDAQGGAI